MSFLASKQCICVAVSRSAPHRLHPRLSSHTPERVSVCVGVWECLAFCSDRWVICCFWCFNLNYGSRVRVRFINIVVYIFKNKYFDIPRWKLCDTPVQIPTTTTHSHRPTIYNISETAHESAKKQRTEQLLWLIETKNNEKRPQISCQRPLKSHYPSRCIIHGSTLVITSSVSELSQQNGIKKQ